MEMTSPSDVAPNRLSEHLAKSLVEIGVRNGALLDDNELNR
jgi:hypothetical protein